MSDDVRATIVSRIQERGHISFAEYMDLALYGPGGYYERPPVGIDGDFITSPHVHPVFGELLAAAIRELHELLGAPTPFRLMEVGAGDGTLARQLIGWLHDVPLEYLAVERSSGAREALVRIPGVWVSDRTERGSHLVLAHELVDDLAFRRVRGTARGPREIRVAIGDDGRLVELLAEPDDDLRGIGAALQPGEEAVHPDGALAFIDEVASGLDRGYALLIDYGAVGSAGGDPHGYRGHTVIEDFLADPGASDITSGIDFALMARRAVANGLVAFQTLTQRDALMALGFERWITAELMRQREQLGRKEGADAVRTWTRRSRATLLVDPSALGRMRWLLLATSGLAAPQWLGHP
ncbi:MAG: SAM-dependent methyltransferase [Actinomycetota bacterium]|nr:SAM-dependent methyltransferase [Actinomycetota bacterium]